MARIKAENKQTFQRSLERRLQKREKGEALRRFSRYYYAQVSLKEALSRDWACTEGNLSSAWQFFKSYKGRPLVRVFNPTVEIDGFLQSDTVIEVTVRNMPFLLDSIRIELRRQGHTLTAVRQCALNVIRDTKDHLVIADEGDATEQFIHLEISRTTDLSGLTRAIREVIRLVRRVVDDFAPMRQKLLLLTDEVNMLDDDSKDECQATLRWLYDNNFTFLGYDAFVQEKKEPLKQTTQSLGLSREKFPAADLPLSASAEMITFAKSPQHSAVHRPAYLDEIVLRIEGDDGFHLHRLIGLFTSNVYAQEPENIPWVRQRIAGVYQYQGVTRQSHKGREIARLVEIMPRELLFLTAQAELARMIESIHEIQERNVVRVLVNRDENHHFVNCLVYLPRDAYDTSIRQEIQTLLVEQTEAVGHSFATYFSESQLIRIHFVLQVDPSRNVTIDADDIETQVTRLSRNWEADLRQALIDDAPQNGEERYQSVRGVFPPGYRDAYWPETAMDDVYTLEALSSDEPLRVKLYQWMNGSHREIRFKVMHQGAALPLSDVIPILENLGARTLKEHPYDLRFPDRRVWIHDFVLNLPLDNETPIDDLKANFESAFLEIWNGRIENDGFNRLVTLANMPCRHVWVLRAYARYQRQIRADAGLVFIANCLTTHNKIARLLVDVFVHRHDPALRPAVAAATCEQRRMEILELIDDVDNLNEDRILRQLLALMFATQRTNFFQQDDNGDPKSYLVLKMQPDLVPEMPLPKPRFEIFVYSRRFEGIHLRGGKIARGGLRWSDRTEDYRTEVLGLVKAQQVKNAVIVPVGAKGGFLTKQLPGDQAGNQQEGIACYRMFIQGLLDVTDNLAEGKVVPPDDVVRHDDADYYLVVAADKGTATFSDYANEIAVANHFWLGDAFASGGSVGYDHKAMGITARGAWVSVQQHFRDREIDIQKETVSVVGIGDMSGDVFGNGMLLSESIGLIAAFNHINIFIDPSPDPARSFKERQRLFKLPRSSWQDYNKKLISSGGGIFSRSAKSITLSRQICERFDISDPELTPNELIRAILVSDFELLWNGGIGTYVKSHLESDLDVADKANDAIRVNGQDLRCRVIGEGGNLGMTQLGRVEFNLNGGVCYTDSIDNAGGVNCSDIEVNVKILLNQLVETGRLPASSRNRLLEQMTDEVADVVLESNYQQAQTINLMADQAAKRSYEYVRVMQLLTQDGLLDRELEFLPGEEELQDRMTRNASLTGPELSILTSYVKGWLKESLMQSKLDEPYMQKEALTAFPPTLPRRFADDITAHRLHREIIATEVANSMVNLMGISFPSRIMETTGASIEAMSCTYVAVRDIFELDEYFKRIQSLDFKVSPRLQKDMRLDLIRLVRRSTRWLLRHRPDDLTLSEAVTLHHGALTALLRDWESIVVGEVGKTSLVRHQELVDLGVDTALSRIVSASHHLYALMGVVRISMNTGLNATQVGQLLFRISETLNLNWFSLQIHDYQPATQWESLARESLQDDLYQRQVAITDAIATLSVKQGDDDAMESWTTKHREQIDRWLSVQAELKASPVSDLSIFTVGIRELSELADTRQTPIERDGHRRC